MAVTTAYAHMLAALHATAYVGSIYIAKCARRSLSKARAPSTAMSGRPQKHDERWRDDPDVIRERLVAVTMATMVCCAVVYAVVAALSDDQNDRWTVVALTLARLGVRPASIRAFLVIPVLYLGPLYARYLMGALPLQQNGTFQEDVLSALWCITGVRNFVVAPITEEVVFRACVLSGYHLAGASRTKMIFLSPMVFGAAHLHHAWETYKRYGRSAAALKRAVMSTVFQFKYTTAFGFYCSYSFLRTGSVFPSITAHVFCNVMGLPQPGYEMRERPDRKLGIVVAYVAGVVGFVCVLKGWTHTEGSLYWS